MATGKQKWYAFGALRKKASSLVLGIGDIYAKIWRVRTSRWRYWKKMLEKACFRQWGEHVQILGVGNQSLEHHQQSSMTGLHTMHGPFSVGYALLERPAHWISSPPVLTLGVLHCALAISLLLDLEPCRAFRVESITCFNENALEVMLRVRKWPCRFQCSSCTSSLVKARPECSHVTGLIGHHLEKINYPVEPCPNFRTAKSISNKIVVAL